MTRRGSTEVDVPEYRASPTSASQRDFASTTRGSEHAIYVLAICPSNLDTKTVKEGRNLLLSSVLLTEICT